MFGDPLKTMKFRTFKVKNTKKGGGQSGDFRLITTQSGHKFFLPVCIYQQNAKPNRFDIKPGYRWDGVDRSNNYEQRWFNKANKIEGQKHEYKQWAQEDM